MDSFYLAALVLLFLLAISDLIVGVSNDAVNFLNSAIGSKVSSRKTIMWVASAGILIGATFSSGIMEVAQKGIFHPGSFFFHEIIIIFLAVMITDIVLLDLFNTYGMPTSTTVSIIFELLGASFALAAIKLMGQGLDLGDLPNYINSDSALAIILGIFLSVAFAFTTGALVQFITRVVFSFNYLQRFAKLGFLATGLSLSFLTYFMLIKGVKGASFVNESFISYVENNTLMLWAISLAFWMLFSLLLQKVFKVNLLKMIVFIGTFSLAMAFAGNDLVNFIGVPIAGLHAFEFWQASGESSTSYLMTALETPIKTNTLLLLAAGLIMVVTLWFSKKAQSVTETEVNLSRQGEGTEKFTPNMLSRGVIRLAISLNEVFKSVLPQRMLSSINSQFKPVATLTPGESPKAAFDLLRASVNLTLASMLIAFATSLKLPLSTTYVSFMVAMGTSLADRAWGSESAVYRVSGVLSVIGGWFLTAFIAFCASGIVALSLYLSLWMIVPILGLVVFLVIRSSSMFNKLGKHH